MEQYHFKNGHFYNIHESLRTKWLGKHIVYRQTLPSTQTLGHELAQKGAEHGTVIIADEQTEGRGQRNRPWNSQREKGLWVSLLLRPALSTHQITKITLLAAVALAKFLDQDLHIQPQIKWPNDLLIQGRKVAGILTEMDKTNHDSSPYVVLGIGLNVNHSLKDLQQITQYKATSLRIEAGKTWNLTDLLSKLLFSFEKQYTDFIDCGFLPIKKRWEYYGFKIGKKVQLKIGQTVETVKFVGLNEKGALLIEDGQGIEKEVYSANIQWF